MSMFKRAVKHESKLRLAIMGPSGSGKTYTALAIATNLGGKVAVVDTEHGSASKYADIFEFDVLELAPPYHPKRFVEAIQAASEAGYSTVILDSLTHAWNGTGGMLEIVDAIAKRSNNPNSFAAWKDATPIQNHMVEGIVGASIHVIATLRSKQDYAQERDDRGKTVIRKVGMAAQQRDGFEYEFDVVLDMDIDHNGIVTKSRATTIADRVFAKPGKEIANLLTDWLKGAPAPEPNPAIDKASAATIKALHAAGKQLMTLATWKERGPDFILAVTGSQPADLTEEGALAVIAELNQQIASLPTALELVEELAP